jgi:hypothetical protein
MEVIRFQSGSVVYRAIGEHDFHEGYDGVASVSRADARPHHTSAACRRPIVKNLCGRFLTYLQGFVPHAAVSQSVRTCFGRCQHMHHLHGSVSVHRGVAHFRGCSGYDGIAALSEDLFMQDPACEVHMGVLKCCLGRFLDTHQGCHLEAAVASRFSCLRVRRRLLDGPQAVKLRVDRFDEAELPFLSGGLTPTSLDVSVTSRGVATFRFSWSRCRWSRESEAAVLHFCGWLAERLRDCC